MMTWEAFRLTSKPPAEVYAILGPHAADELIRHAMNSCWRQVPEEGRTYQSVRDRVATIFNRNMRVWSAIKKPAPEAFFQNLETNEADQLFRQAFVLTWMMMPRAGGRKFADVKKIVQAIYERNLVAWDEDNITFTKGFGKKPVKAKTKAKVRTTTDRRRR